MKKIIGISLLLLSSAAFAGSTSSKTVADVANTVITSIDGVPDLMAAISYVSGIVCGIKGILKFKENNESKGQVKMTVPIILMAASAIFLSLPTIIKIGTQTIGVSEVKEHKTKYEF